jgi:hypothetical protein
MDVNRARRSRRDLPIAVSLALVSAALPAEAHGLARANAD